MSIEPHNIKQFMSHSLQLLGLPPSADSENKSIHPPARCCKRDILEEILSASRIAFGEKDGDRHFLLSEVFPNLSVIASLYLRSFPPNAKISAERYIATLGFSAALCGIDPDFEFPIWDGRPIKDFLRYQDVNGWPSAVRICFPDPTTGKPGATETSISCLDFLGARPFSDNGWELPSGERFLVIFSRR